MMSSPESDPATGSTTSTTESSTTESKSVNNSKSSVSSNILSKNGNSNDVEIGVDSKVDTSNRNITDIKVEGGGRSEINKGIARTARELQIKEFDEEEFGRMSKRSPNKNQEREPEQYLIHSKGSTLYSAEETLNLNPEDEHLREDPLQETSAYANLKVYNLKV